MKYLLIVLLFSCSVGTACAQSVAVKKQTPKTEKNEAEIVIVDLVGPNKEFDGKLYLIDKTYYIAESMEQVLDKLKIVFDKDIAGMNVNKIEGLKLNNPALINKVPEKYRAKLKGEINITLKPKAKK